jgi:DegV family protein with EDD domain
MTHKIALITDSTNDIPEKMREQYEIGVVPLTVVWGEQTYLDGVEMSAESFYERLRSDPVRPTTSQATPADFIKAYEMAREHGAEEIVACILSSGFSGTIQAARQAAESSKIPVTVVDSKGNSMSMGWQVIAMARARDEGATVAEMTRLADGVRERMHYHIALDTLEYLVKGGRIGSAARLIGNVLKIKPQIRVNHQIGAVEAGDISTTRKKAIENLFASFFKKMDLNRPLHIAVLHNAVEEEAIALLERVKAEFNPAELLLTIVSPILGVHTGPGAIALCGYSEP